MTGHGVLDATGRLRGSLDALAEALLAPDLGRLIAAEVGLAEALNEVGRLRTVSGADRQSLISELIAARAALERCRVLGCAMSDSASAMLQAQSRAGEYGPTGTTAALSAPRGQDFTTRI